MWRKRAKLRRGGGGGAAGAGVGGGAGGGGGSCGGRGSGRRRRREWRRRARRGRWSKRGGGGFWWSWEVRCGVREMRCAALLHRIVGGARGQAGANGLIRRVNGEGRRFSIASR